jgi:hypothetical protein
MMHSRFERRRHWYLVLLAAVVATAGCSQMSPPSPAAGDERGACRPGGGCSGDLVCASGICVRLDTPPQGGSGGARVIEEDGGTGATAGTTGGGSGGAVGGAGAPIFLTLTANTALLEYQQTLTVAAVLTDPDGIDDLIGGVLVDPTTGNSYGAFMTAAAEGSYSLMVPWAAINTVAAIDADPPGVDRRFRAEFFDSAGHKTTRDLTVRLRCNAPGARTEQACCDGKQFFVNARTSCGTCNRACVPPAWSSYVFTACTQFHCSAQAAAMPTLQSCTAACASLGATCREINAYSTPERDDWVGFAQYAEEAPLLPTCDAVPAPVGPTTGSAFRSVTCMCSYESPPSWYSELP